MVVLKRLFVTYYFLFIQKKRFQKNASINKLLVERNEDEGALALLVTSQFLLAMLMLGLLFKHYDLHKALLAFLALTIYALLFTSQYFYFVRNREKRRKAIEEFRQMPYINKVLWSIVAACLIVGPICLFPILFSK